MILGQVIARATRDESIWTAVAPLTNGEITTSDGSGYCFLSGLTFYTALLSGLVVMATIWGIFLLWWLIDLIILRRFIAEKSVWRNLDERKSIFESSRSSQESKNSKN